MTQVPIPENQLGTMQMMREVSEHVTMNCLEIPDSGYVAQPIHDFLFPREEEMGSAENSIALDEDEGFSEKCLHSNHQRWNLDQFFNL